MPLRARPRSVSLLLLLLAGCREHALHLRIPHGFHGQVVVSCDSNGERGSAVTIDAQGHGRAAVCPGDDAKVYLDRDGGSTLVQDAAWLKTGDGLVTQLRLTVR